METIIKIGVKTSNLNNVGLLIKERKRKIDPRIIIVSIP